MQKNKPLNNKRKKTPSTKKALHREKTINKILLIILASSVLIFVIANIEKKYKYISASNATQSLEIENTSNETSPPPDENNATKNTNAAMVEKEENLDKIDPSQDNRAIEKALKQDTPSTPSKDSTLTTTLTLYFIKINENEEITAVPYTRTVPFTSAILTRTIQELLNGPTTKEIKNGASHYIPNDTELINASVSNGIALLDFDENFHLNEYGSAGILAQLYQVVLSATKIPSINSVQIIINGKKSQYLGGEGRIEIAVPLTSSYLDSF